MPHTGPSPCHDVAVPTASDHLATQHSAAEVAQESPRATVALPAVALPTVVDDLDTVADLAPGPPPIRAALRPGTVVVVRDLSSVQVGLAPDRTVVVAAPSSCGPQRLAALLDEIDGGTDLSDAAARTGIGATELPAIARILVHLAELGYVRIWGQDRDVARSADAPRLGPIRRVHLLGAGQVSEILRGPLSVNGCRVTSSPSPGLSLDLDRPPWHRRGPAPDLVILAGPVSIDPVLIMALARARQPHLHVHCRDGRVVVGPTVIPGKSSCLRCANLYRADRDPQWPFVVAQLISRTPRAEVPALTAAAALVLAEIAATRSPDLPVQTIGATVEINPAEGLWQRREWPADVRCPCGAAAGSSPLS